MALDALRETQPLSGLASHRLGTDPSPAAIVATISLVLFLAVARLLRYVLRARRQPETA